jgi:NAD(P)H dehydrogenase (quinone)
MLDGFSGGRTIEIAGAEAVTSADLARIAATISGRPVAHVPVSEQEVIAGMVAHGLPEPMAKVYARFDVAAARGELAGSARAFVQLTGAQPQPVSAFLAAHRGALGAS